MKILHVVSPWKPVEPDAKGGTEHFVHMLDTELTRRGHVSTVVARGDSNISGRLIPVLDQRMDSVAAEGDNLQYAAGLVSAAALEEILVARDYDIVHNHAHDIMAFGKIIARYTPSRIVTSLHFPPNCYWNSKSFSPFDHNNMNIALSNNEKENFQRTGLNIDRVIYNGVDIPHFLFLPEEKEDYLLFMGRVCKEKGAHDAIHIAIDSGRPLVIAGPVEKTYFEEYIAPFLGPNIRYVGHLTGREKKETLTRAAALLMPVDMTLWPDPCPLVPLEAFASGTPILAYPSGALPELVELGGGIICKDKDEMIAALSRDLLIISPYSCRAAAEKHFSIKRMADEYEQAYIDAMQR